MFNGRRQPSGGVTSRMTRECQVRICERLGVKFPGSTRPDRRSFGLSITAGIGGTADSKVPVVELLSRLSEDKCAQTRKSPREPLN